MPQADQSLGRGAVWRRLGVLGLAVAAVGLPVNQLFDYFLLVLAAIAIFTGEVTHEARRWLSACALVAVVVAGHGLFPAPRIEEGHNAFLIDGPGGALERALPADAFAQMKARFEATYPRERHCARDAHGCWRPKGIPTRPFADSMDAVYDAPAYSRRVTDIDFRSPLGARLGFINERPFDWAPTVTDIQRAYRDNRSWVIFGRWTLGIPVFVMYRFPPAFVGSALCWRGEVLWEGANETFASIKHDRTACRTLAPEDAGRRIFGVSIDPKLPLAMSLHATLSVELRHAAAYTFMTGAGVLGALFLLVWLRPRRMLFAAVLVAAALIVVILDDSNFVTGLRPLDGFDDGLQYEDYGRAIVRDLLAGNFASAFQGSEPIYHFTPFMRYFRALEHVIFGDTFLGYLSVMLVLPFLVFGAFKRLMPLSWALLLALGFVATPLGTLLGSSFYMYTKWAARGFADPLAYALFLAGFILLIGRAGNDERPVSHTFWGSFLLALAVLTRPNLVLAVGVVMAGATLMALWRRQAATVVAFFAGFAVFLLSPLHNWMFSGTFVLLTNTAGMPVSLVVPPWPYVAAIGELLRLDFSGDNLARVTRRLIEWFSTPSEIPVFIPLHLAVFAILFRVMFSARFEPWLRLTALATLAQSGIGFTYNMFGRYHFLTWLLESLVVAAWLHAEGLALFARRWPQLYQRVARHPVAERLNGLVARTCEVFGFGARQ
jgi:hypothetical protein